MRYRKLSFQEFTSIYLKVPRSTVDIVIKTTEGILLTKRAIEPFKGKWHIPGGTILFKEPLKHAINRIIQDELGIRVKVLKPLGIIEYFDDGGRHTISNAFLAEIKRGLPRVSDQGKQIRYFKKIPKNCIPDQKKFLENLDHSELDLLEN